VCRLVHCSGILGWFEEEQFGLVPGGGRGGGMVDMRQPTERHCSLPYLLHVRLQQHFAVSECKKVNLSRNCLRFQAQIKVFLSGILKVVLLCGCLVSSS
jgi:hypothetical protein